MEGKPAAEVILYSCVSTLGSRNYHPSELPMHQLGEMEGLVRNSIAPCKETCSWCLTQWNRGNFF